MEEISLFGTVIFNFLGINFTNTYILGIICAVLVFGLFAIALQKKEMIPGKFQNFFEFLLETIFNFFDGMTGDRKKTEEIFPLAATLFFLIIFSNLIEIIPGTGVFPFLRSPSSDLHFTLALAIFSMGFIHVVAISKLGIFTYFKKYIKFENPVMFFVGILEALGEVTRTFSLGMRLFGNLFAGEMLLMVICSIMPFFLPIPFLGLELFVAFIQAIVFSSLITVFYVVTTSAEEH
ncbi:MAG: F0F1 ATP synthase subunit A [Candidatus Paceibacterota bacterium]|jgi:F-type H+-transporting ATPase subunit a|nr:F0F1 ATP synthase subunit A [bacterium]